MSVLKIIFIFLEVLLLFNLLIFVHELGHFLAARWRGLKIDRFAIWFGKPIWMDKIIVAFAGPLFSFLLALAFAVVVMIVGRPVSEAEMTTTIGYVEKDSPAEKVG